jgi:hypothetical protein
MKSRVDTILRELLSRHSRETAVEAAYYAVRDLKQRLVPEESRKEHFVDGSNSEPSPDAMELAVQIIETIERNEDRPLVELSHTALHHYIAVLLETIRAKTDSTLKIDAERGRELLAKLRDRDPTA